MIQVIMTKGLPASGKSTWAKEIISNNPNKYKRINKDDLRAMLDNSKHSNSSEKFVLKIRDLIIMQAIDAGKHVIIDDTNLCTKHEEHIKQLIKGRANLIIKDFTDITLDICIERDLKRPISVGEKVIRNMYNTYLRKKETYVINKKLTNAIIVDIDGTLAIMNKRTPFEWSKVKSDLCNENIKNIVNLYNGKVILVSGRDGICKDLTIEWLNENKICFNQLFMRDAGNNEKDTVIKKRIYDQEIKDKYNIEYVLDDRNCVVEMWRNLGLTCLQVNEGDF